MANPYSKLGPDDFQAAAMNLLPRGWAWPRGLDTVLAKFMGAIGDLFASFHADASNVVDNELYAPSTQALLPEWERNWGLPDPCTPQPQTYEQRIAALIARITDQGNLSRQKYIDLAAALGFVITITEGGFDGMTCIDTCIDALGTAAGRFTWIVNAPATTVTELTCLGRCTDPLRSWGNDILECVIRRHNRPSRIVLFSYS